MIARISPSVSRQGTNSSSPGRQAPSSSSPRRLGHPARADVGGLPVQRALRDEVRAAAVEALVEDERDPRRLVRRAQQVVDHLRRADDRRGLVVVPLRPVDVDDHAGEADRLGQHARDDVEHRLDALVAADDARDFHQRLKPADGVEVLRGHGTVIGTACRGAAGRWPDRLPRFGDLRRIERPTRVPLRPRRAGRRARPGRAPRSLSEELERALLVRRVERREPVDRPRPVRLVRPQDRRREVRVVRRVGEVLRLERQAVALAVLAAGRAVQRAVEEVARVELQARARSSRSSAHGRSTGRAAAPRPAGRCRCDSAPSCGRSRGRSSSARCSSGCGRRSRGSRGSRTACPRPDAIARSGSASRRPACTGRRGSAARGRRSCPCPRPRGSSRRGS